MDDVLVLFGIARLVEHIPAQRFKERIQKFLPQLCLVVLARMIRLAMFVKTPYQLYNDVRCGHCPIVLRDKHSSRLNVPKVKQINNVFKEILRDGVYY